MVTQTRPAADVPSHHILSRKATEKMTAKTAPSDDSKLDIIFALRLFLDAVLPEASIHQLFTRAIREIERLRTDNERLERDIERKEENLLAQIRHNAEMRAQLDRLLPPLDRLPSKDKTQ